MFKLAPYSQEIEDKAVLGYCSYVIEWILHNGNHVEINNLYNILVWFDLYASKEDKESIIALLEQEKK